MSFRRLASILTSALLTVATFGTVTAPTASAAPTAVAPAITRPAAAEKTERVRPRLRVTVRDRERHLAPGHWARIKVRVRNVSRTKARVVRVRVAKHSGLTLRKRVLRLGGLAPGARLTAVVRVRLDVTRARNLKVSATARGARTRTTTVRLVPRATTWRGALQPGGEPVRFTMSADGRSLRNVTVPRAPGTCADHWDGGEPRHATLRDIVIPVLAVRSDGTVDADIDLADERLDWDRRATLRVTLRGGAATGGSFSYSEVYADPIHWGECKTSPYRIPWTATRQ
ncbi:hypothetical protein [Mumia sp. Pv 4-285]|uniref:hypothetical protein n=1 Tax=Mumia qirimensis TaxID=3234852 RepID=UPI00351D60CE